jgi:hypothetical protein
LHHAATRHISSVGLIPSWRYHDPLYLLPNLVDC